MDDVVVEGANEVERTWRERLDPPDPPLESQQSGDQDPGGNGPSKDGNQDQQDSDPQKERADQESGQQDGEPQEENSQSGQPQEGGPGSVSSATSSAREAASKHAGEEHEAGGEAEERETEVRDDLNNDALGASDFNDEALSEASTDTNWGQMRRERIFDGINDRGSQETNEEKFVTDAIPDWKDNDPNEQVEEAVRQFAYEINRQQVGTDWTPEKIEDHRIAQSFALVVSKLAEDMSYREVDGDEFWDARKIMKRQIDNRPLHHCKKDYDKRRLALLVDTSPSCRDEAVFYSKIASGGLLRDDIDIFLAPNGSIDGRFDRDHMRFVHDTRGENWDLDGRVVLYFTDWDGSENIAEQSKNCTLYWFDNCPPENYWDKTSGTRSDFFQNIRQLFRGSHHYCPDKSTFQKIARKIRP